MSLGFRKQKTIKSPIEVSGRSYWSGLDVNMRFLPAPADTGIVFQRIDVPNQTRIPATITHRVDVPRRTVLVKGTDTVDMIEHVMATLVGLGVDNCIIQIDRSEVPSLDGSSIGFLRLLNSVGVVQQKADRPQLIVTKPIKVGDENSWIQALPNPNGNYEIRYHLEYPHPIIGHQDYVYIHSTQAFAEDLAPARTFLMENEAKALRGMGVGLRVSNQEVLVFDEHGPVENRLRFDNECVRHKTLDVLGDLALAPYDIVGTIVAHRSGHRLNARLAQMLLANAEIRYEQQRRSA